ncbi:YihY/virulence factor BrkB family protein [Couchioplanes caeruleus]|uniref:Ribonuclease n=2 Tax=Couchioplanes caeruleus TaxID=56438 RepID=A0A1K0FG59_9ACTN|nr:YihY/virulence factor BrkB family protein [Couchioplanes caeruleus]OJF11831.1 ribonuclease [Couchioplanes caeruleus subsp. caeruleus]ROP33207.1 membrane protein [Couchioplanes caeruleus]
MTAATTRPTVRSLPRGIRQLRWSTWRGVLWRSANGYLDDECADLAAALTYNAVLAVFPVAIVVVALVNLVTDGRTAVSTILGILEDLGAGSVVGNDNFRAVLDAVIVEQGSPKTLLGFGVLGALWSASAYVGVFTRASNRIYGVKEGRPVWKLRPLQILLSAVALVLMAVVGTGLVISGPLVDAVGNVLHADSTARTAWSIGRWPVLVMILMLLLSLLFWIAPNVRQPRFRWLTLGGAVALLVWVLASFGFGLYVANFGSYDETYGSLGAIIAFLVWLYLANSALMLGVEINAEVQRGRHLQAGETDPDPPLPPKEPAEDEPDRTV